MRFYGDSKIILFLAYKLFFSFSIISKVEILREMNNKLKKYYATKFMVMLIKP